MRAAFTKLFPNLDKILSVDNDIIINENISELWDIDLENNYFAGVSEPRKSTDDFSLEMLNEDKVPEDKYLVLGDNRPISKDSRIIGLIDEKDIFDA